MTINQPTDAEAWENEVAAALPERYDGEEDQRDIILRAVKDMAARETQEPTGLDDPEMYREIATETEWHIRTAFARGYAKAKGTDIPDGVIDAQIESAVRAITTLAARRDKERR